MNENSEIATRKVSVGKAYRDLQEIFSNPEHEDYLLKDSELYSKYNISRTTMQTIRSRLNIPSRPTRILNLLLKMGNLQNMYMEDILAALGERVKYQALYKIIQTNDLDIKKKNKND